MTRTCPDCHGHKVMPGSYDLNGRRITQTCGLCGGRGTIHGKRPGRGHPTHKTTLKRRERREARKAKKEARAAKRKEERYQKD